MSDPARPEDDGSGPAAGAGGVAASQQQHAPIAGPLASGTTPSLTLARSLQCTAESLASMPPLDLFTAQMSCDSSEARVDAMKKLHVVADAIGTEQTLSRLIPYLASTVAMPEDGSDEADDEILLILAEQLGDMVPRLVPGHRALPFLPLLERLAAVEETVVRDKAVESVNKIVPLLLPATANDSGGGRTKKNSSSEGGGDDDDATPRAAPSILLAASKRLAGADWFTARVSAAGILPVAYAFFNEHARRASSSSGGSGGDEADAAFRSDAEAQRELRVLYKDLSEDETPMVRRGAARHLGRFVEAVAGLSSTAAEIANGRNNKGGNLAVVDDGRKKLVTDEMVPLFQSLSGDEQDSVRLLAVAAAGSVGCGLGSDGVTTAELVLPVVRGGCIDLSWRVRHNLAKEFSTVAGSLGFTDAAHQAQQTEVFQCFANLLQDSEAEVRAAGVENVARMTQLGGPDLFMAHVAPVLPALADDPVMEVRSKLAQTLMDCCNPAVCDALTDDIVLQEFKPLLEGFLNDEFAEVQLHILTKLSRVSHLLNKMDVVVSSILQMAKAQNWRVREAVGRLLPHLAEARGVSFFEDHLLEPWMKLLLDQVADVRSACVTGMPKLLSVSGAAWIQREILPHYVRMYDESQSYLTRITVLRSFAALAEDRNMNAALLEEIVSFLLRGLEDRVANVRMVAARGLSTVSGSCEDAMLNAKVRPALNARVAEDEDDDCKHFAQIALDACA